MKHDYLKLGALLFALVATASAEYELARAVGFNQWVAAAVPGALDIYTVRAMRAHRDVLIAVAAMIGVNAASHLVTAGLLPVNVPLVVAVSAIAPLVLWRVHALRTEPVAATASSTLGNGTVGAVPEVEAAGTSSKLDEVKPAEAADAGSKLDQASPPVPAVQPASAPAVRRPRQTPGVARNARPVRSDDELLTHLQTLRTGADGPLSVRTVIAQLGIGTPRLRALLDAHGVTLDPLPTPRVLHAVDDTEPVLAAAGGGAR